MNRSGPRTGPCDISLVSLYLSEFSCSFVALYSKGIPLEHRTESGSFVHERDTIRAEDIVVQLSVE